MTQITVTNFEEKESLVFWYGEVREAIQNYHGSILNVPNPGAPTIQMEK
jgi:hypothetical protein